MDYQDPLDTTGGHRAYSGRNEPHTVLRVRRQNTRGLAIALGVLGLVLMAYSALADHFLPTWNLGVGTLVMGALAAALSASTTGQLTCVEEIHAVQSRVLRELARAQERQNKIDRRLDEIRDAVAQNSDRLDQLGCTMREILQCLESMEVVERQIETAIHIQGDQVRQRRQGGP